MSYYRSGEFSQTSHAETLRMIDEKISKLQEQIELLVLGLNKKNSKTTAYGGFDEDMNDDFKENHSPAGGSKGMFRDPVHAAFEREKSLQKKV